MDGKTAISLLPGERFDRINEHLSLIQKKDGLTFGTDAYLLSAFLRKASGVGADLGSGTGVAALLALAGGKACRMFAVEVQDDFISLCRRNAELNGLGDRLVPVHGDVRDINISLIGTEVDFVISNPPYMASCSGKGNDVQAKNIARREILGGIADFAHAASRLLKFGGDFYTVYRPERLCDLISALRDASLEPKCMVLVYPRIDSPPSLVLVRSRKGGRPGLTVAPPIVIYREEGEPLTYDIPEGEQDLLYTECYARIYRDFSLDHVTEQKRQS